MAIAWIVIHEPDGGYGIDGPYDSIGRALAAEEILEEHSALRFVDRGRFYERAPMGGVRRLAGLEHADWIKIL